MTNIIIHFGLVNLHCCLVFLMFENQSFHRLKKILLPLIFVPPICFLSEIRHNASLGDETEYYDASLFVYMNQQLGRKCSLKLCSSFLSGAFATLYSLPSVFHIHVILCPLFVFLSHLEMQKVKSGSHGSKAYSLG